MLFIGVQGAVGHIPSVVVAGLNRPGLVDAVGQAKAGTEAVVPAIIRFQDSCRAYVGFLGVGNKGRHFKAVGQLEQETGCSLQNGFDLTKSP